MLIQTLMVLSLGAVQSTPVPTGRSQQMDAIQYVALALMVLSLGAVLVIVVLARAVARQRRRLIEMQNAQKPTFTGPDPWLEAARRVPVPSAAELTEQMNAPPATPPPAQPPRPSPYRAAPPPPAASSGGAPLSPIPTRIDPTPGEEPKTMAERAPAPPPTPTPEVKPEPKPDRRTQPTAESVSGQTPGTPVGPAAERITPRPLRAHPPAAEMFPTGGGLRARTRPVALVTGAARRVGRAVAVSLARAGCDVYFTYHQSNVEAETLASELAGLGSTGNFYQLDFTDTDAVDAFAANLAATLPRLDILVHNASIYTPSPVMDLSAEDAVRQYRVNALAPLILTAKLSSLLSASELAGGGAVVACADIHAMGRPRRDFAAYSMSKAALAEMVHSMARDLAPAVRVNAIAPGVVAWPERGTDADESSQQKYLRRVPLGRAGTPEDAAEVVRWLAMDATYLTGEIIRVDGGRWLT